MAWTTAPKAMGVLKQTQHVNFTPGLIDRPLGVPSISFTPLELFGAAARVSHLTAVNPAAVSPESEIVRALLEEHVDDIALDFAILKSANGFKDFVKSYFVGSVAAGLAYLAMVSDGYTWADHFESLMPAKKTKSPDFVFAGAGIGTAVMESKGTRGTSRRAFEKRVESGYIDQVEPHLGATIAGSFVSHGYSIGSYLKSTTKADLHIHHTAVPAVGGSSPPSGGHANISAVQRGNFARAFLLAYDVGLARDMRDGESRDEITFGRIWWRGRHWVSRHLLHWANFDDPYDWIFSPSPATIFVIEESIADQALRAFLRRPGEVKADSNFERLERDAFQDRRGLVEGREEGAVFPDGLAVLSGGPHLSNVEKVVWRQDYGFEPA